MAGAEGLGLACRLGRCFCTSCRGLHRRPAPLNTLRVPRSLNHFTQCQNKNGHLSVTVFDLSMGYEKDIFGSFAYDFELSQKLIFG